MRLPGGRWRLLVVVVLVIIAWTARRIELRKPVVGDDAGGEAAIAEAFREQRSDLLVEAEGTVERLLDDDLEGSRHQRFILRLDGGQTLLVSHNIDLAPRAPLAPGDRVAFRGRYEWNELGGVVHWTHHDPEGRHAGGWLEHGGRTYR